MGKLLFAVLIISVAGMVANAQTVPKDWEVSLERTGYLGDCPAYKITIRADGAVMFRNRNNEMETGTLSAERIQQLFGRSNTELILNKGADYDAEKDCDGPYETDWPSEIITVTSNGRSRTVEHNIGCKVRPNTFLMKVIGLAESIDEFTDSMFVKSN